MILYEAARQSAMEHLQEMNKTVYADGDPLLLLDEETLEFANCYLFFFGFDSQHTKHGFSSRHARCLWIPKALKLHQMPTNTFFSQPINGTATTWLLQFDDKVATDAIKKQLFPLRTLFNFTYGDAKFLIHHRELPIVAGNQRELTQFQTALNALGLPAVIRSL